MKSNLRVGSLLSITLFSLFTVFYGIDAHGETDDALAAPSVAAEKSAKQQLETEKFWIRQPNLNYSPAHRV